MCQEISCVLEIPHYMNRTQHPKQQQQNPSDSKSLLSLQTVCHKDVGLQIKWTRNGQWRKRKWVDYNYKVEMEDCVVLPEKVRVDQYVKNG